MNKNNNNNYFSKTLLCLAVGGGLTYIRKFKSNNNNNIETNNIDTIFNNKNTNNPVIYTKEERNEIFNEFIKSKNTTHIIQNNIEKNQLKIIERVNNIENKDIHKDIHTITNNELNTQNNENTYKFYTNKDCYYKIKIIIHDSSSIIINLNNFKYNIENNENNENNEKKNHIFIFDNIMFEKTYQTLEINNKFDIFIKEYPINNINLNKGLIIITENNNSYPYFLNNNLLPDFVEKDQF
jgi:hypothetical protein